MKILKKSETNWEENSTWFQKNIVETLLEKTEVIWNWCWYYEEILESFPEIISAKLRRNYEEILEQFFKI